MAKPRVFIGSSVEGLNVAYAVQQNLLHDAEVTVWDQGIFELSKTTIESLSKALQESDFAVFVFSPDDLIRIRSTPSAAVRDNVLFEFGLFIGKLGRDRVYFLMPMNGELHLPSDLLGITPGRYEEGRADGSMQAATGAACNQIRIQMRHLGFAPGHLVSAVNSESGESRVGGSWLKYFIDKKYSEARDALLEGMSTQVGDDVLKYQAWVLMCEYHIGGEVDISPVTNFAEAHSDNPSVQVSVAHILRFEQRASAAMSILANAQAKYPKDESISRAIALCHSDSEDNESAIAELQRFGPEQFPDVAIDLADVLEREEKIEEALQIVRRCFINHPTHVGLRYKYARLAQDADLHEVAVALLWGLSVEKPDSIDYLGYLGNSCLSLDLYDQALQAYRKAEALMESEDSSQWIVANIGNLLKNKGLYSEAIVHLESSLKWEPMSEYAHDRMAVALKSKSAEQKLFEKAKANGKRQIREAELKLLSCEVSKTPDPEQRQLGIAAALSLEQG